MCLVAKIAIGGSHQTTPPPQHNCSALRATFHCPTLGNPFLLQADLFSHITILNMFTFKVCFENQNFSVKSDMDEIVF